MVTVTFPEVMRRHVECDPVEVEGQTVAEVLTAVFAARPQLESYLLDDEGGLRKHMALFVDGTQIEDRRRLSDPVGAGSTVAVLQALSGG